VRGQDDVGGAAQRVLERLPVALGLGLEHVNGRPGDVPGVEGVFQGRGVDDKAARQIEEQRAGTHLSELLRAEEPAVVGASVDVQRDGLRLGEQFLQRGAPFRVAEREPIDEVVEQDPHAEGLRDDRQLAADIAVADQAERPAADLMAADGGLHPFTGMHLRVVVGEVAGQGDDLADRQFHDRAGVAVGGVEHGDAPLGGLVQGDLVGADAERPDGLQAVGLGQNAAG
jgi:hypothetical protein